MFKIIQKLKDKKKERFSNEAFENSCKLLGIGVRNIEKEAKLLSFKSLASKRDKMIKDLELLDGVKNVFVTKINTICVVKSDTHRWFMINDN